MVKSLKIILNDKTSQGTIYVKSHIHHGNARVRAMNSVYDNFMRLHNTHARWFFVVVLPHISHKRHINRSFCFACGNVNVAANHSHHINTAPVSLDSPHRCGAYTIYIYILIAAAWHIYHHVYTFNHCELCQFDCTRSARECIKCTQSKVCGGVCARAPALARLFHGQIEWARGIHAGIYWYMFESFVCDCKSVYM